MIRAVIFDVGGVLVRTHNHEGRRRWEQKLGLAVGESEEIVFGGEMGSRAQLGEISNVALWQWIGERLQLDEAALARFQHDFWAGDVLDVELVNYVRRLRPFYHTAIISNATDNLRHTLTHTYPIADAFDVIVCSAEEKVMKPDARIFQVALQRLGCEPGEAVFVDDFAHNVDAARQLGLRAIHFQAGVNVATELARLGVIVVEK